jgi:glycosyltransferase involved in cell wall biosynthesis
MRRHGADISLFPGSILPWINPVPAVMVVHDLCWESYPECYPEREIRIFRDIYPRSLKSAKMVFAVSEWTKGEITRVYGTPPEKIRVVPNGVDPQFVPVPQAAESVSMSWGLSPGYILAVGTAHPRKNIAILLRAYAQMPQTGRPPLVLTGPIGATVAPLRELAEALGIAPQIRWLGYVEKEALPALYRGAGVFVMPSLYEGFGLPVSEAMACGTPVICSNTAALPEVAGEAGLLIDPTKPEALAEALQKVLHNPELAEEMRQKGWQQALQFNWDHSGRLALKYFQEACGC